MKSVYFRIKKFKALSKSEKGRIYIFCGFGSPLSFYLPAITRYRRHGFSVVTFRFKTKTILGLSIDTLPEAINEVVDMVTELEKSNSSEKPVIAIGNSMGSVFAWHATAKVPSVSKIIANTGYALISRHIFEDKIGKPWKKKLTEDGIDQQQFRKEILASEPISVIPKVKGKEVLICLNKDDNVISFSNSILYKKVLEENNIPYHYIENSKMRHGTAIMKNLLSRRLLEFIKS